jgi:hypothetical protein
LVLWNRGGRLALCMNKKDSGEHPFPKIKIPVSTRRPGFFKLSVGAPQLSEALLR